MSMEIYVLSDRQLSSMEVWQTAVEKYGVSLRLSPATPFAGLHGALPVVLDQRPSAFECDHFNARELMEDPPAEVEFDRAWAYALAFRWGADVYAGASAYAAAAAYAAATDGVILDCEEGRFISAQRAVEISRELTQSQPMIDEAVRRVLELYKKQAPQ